MPRPRQNPPLPRQLAGRAALNAPIPTSNYPGDGWGGGGGGPAGSGPNVPQPPNPGGPGGGGDGGGGGGGGGPAQPPRDDGAPPRPDDQDRQLNYYTPLRDIFMRPSLPTLRGPFALLGTAALFHAAPGKLLYNFCMTQALYQSKNTVKASLLHIGGNIFKWAGGILGDAVLKVSSLSMAAVTGYMSEVAFSKGQSMLKQAAKIAAPKLMTRAQMLQSACDGLNIIAKPVGAVAIAWAIYVLARHAIEPPPYEAPEGTYPSGGPIVEITQEEARNKAKVFTCPAPLARVVQERVLMCERDPTMIQKVKSIAARWCDQHGLQNNQRYQAVAGAVAAAMTVPCIEQQIIQLAQSHAVQNQYSRLQRYLSGIKHVNDPWYTKYLLYRR